MPLKHSSHFVMAFIGRHRQGRFAFTVLEVDGGTPLKEELCYLFTVSTSGLWGSTAMQRAHTTTGGLGAQGPSLLFL